MIRKIRRIVAVVVCLCVITVATSSCAVIRLMEAILPERASPVERYEYTLTQADVDAFYGLLRRCEALMIPEGKDTAAIEQALGEMSESFYHISTQSSLAYLRFCIDTADKTCSEQSLVASAASSEAYAAYMKLCQRLDASQSAYRETFFEGWSQGELAEMRSYTDGMAALQQTNDAILVEYRELAQEDLTDPFPFCLREPWKRITPWQS